MESTEELFDTVLHQEIDAELSGLEGFDLNIANDMHKKIVKADFRGEIGRINRTFFNSLKAYLRASANISKECLRLLDKANIYCWIAYSIYDEALDNNMTSVVPCANIILRKSYLNYLQAGVPVDFIDEQFSFVDNANSKEVHLRNSSSVNLELTASLMSKKSIAHCLGQLWITSQLSPDNLRKATRGFNNYCAARQLSDDIYDWREDIMNHQHTYATTTLLRQASIKNLEKIEESDFELLNIAFWQNGLEDLCEKVKELSSVSSSHLSFILGEKSDYIELYVNKLYLSAHKSIETHRLKKREFASAKN